MDIDAVHKGLAKGRVFRDLGHETPLGLTQVGVDKDAARGRRREVQLHPGRQVLRIRVSAGDATGVRADDLEVLGPGATVGVEMIADTLDTRAADLGRLARSEPLI